MVRGEAARSLRLVGPAPGTWGANSVTNKILSPTNKILSPTTHDTARARARKSPWRLAGTPPRPTLGQYQPRGRTVPPPHPSLIPGLRSMDFGWRDQGSPRARSRAACAARATHTTRAGGAGSPAAVAASACITRLISTKNIIQKTSIN